MRVSFEMLQQHLLNASCVLVTTYLGRLEASLNRPELYRGRLVAPPMTFETNKNSDLA